MAMKKWHEKSRSRIALAGVLLFALYLGAGCRGPGDSNYLVKVVEKATDDCIQGARVIIEVPREPPLDETTDVNGIAVIAIDSSHAGQRGKLIVEAPGYKKYEQNITLVTDALPDVVQLEVNVTVADLPVLTPPLPPCYRYQRATDDETIRLLIDKEAEAANTEDISIILVIFDPDAIIRRGDTEEHWPSPEKYYEPAFANADFKGARHFGIEMVRSADGSTVLYYVSGSEGEYKTGDNWQSYYNASRSNPPPPYGSEHWTFKKNSAGCWVITEFAFNSGHIVFPP
jgi:hypothetical protein